MRVKARRVGNSLTVTIPKELVLEAGIEEGADLNIFVREDAVVIEPAVSRWDQLVATVRRDAESRKLTEAAVERELDRVRRSRA